MASVDGELIAAIYEAGVIPEKWPAVLEAVGEGAGAPGGNLIRWSDEGADVVSSPRVEFLTREFGRSGWHGKNTRISRRMARATYPGFLTDSDLHSEEELRTLPMYAEFLNPHGAEAGAGTIVQGADNDGLFLTIEGFPGHEASRRAVPWLDTLRPHLARALVLSAQSKAQKMRAAITALDAIGVAAALLDQRGRAQGANPLFAAHLGSLLHDRPSRLHAVDAAADALLSGAIEKLRGRAEGSSIVLRDADFDNLTVLHLVPLRGEARDIFSGTSAIAVLANPRNRQVPEADLIQALFDVTPAEARVARWVAQGKAPAAIAAETGLSAGTVRFQLKQVFQKTGTGKQSELAILLGGFAAPGS